MIAIITFSCKSITCWFMVTAVTVAGTAWNKCFGEKTCLNDFNITSAIGGGVNRQKASGV